MSNIIPEEVFNSKLEKRQLRERLERIARGTMKIPDSFSLTQLFDENSNDTEVNAIIRDLLSGVEKEDE